MQPVAIVSPGARPLSVIAQINYRAVDKETSDARGRVSSTVLAGPLRTDRSVYEFPGDRTYETYLAQKAAY